MFACGHRVTESDVPRTARRYRERSACTKRYCLTWAGSWSTSISGAAIAALEALCPYPAAEIPRRLAPTGLVERFETGLVEPRDFFDQFAGILELQLDYDHFCNIWSSIFTHAILPESLLEGLARRYRLVLLSNTNALHFEMIRENYGQLLRHFRRSGPCPTKWAQ